MPASLGMPHAERLAKEAASFLLPEPKMNVYPRTSLSGAGGNANQ